MPAQHKKNAAKAHTEAAHHANESAKHYEAGDHQKAAHHATVSKAKGSEARKHSNKATAEHAKKHGDK